jgi:hypothetical protein
MTILIRICTTGDRWCALWTPDAGVFSFYVTQWGHAAPFLPNPAVKRRPL